VARRIDWLAIAWIVASVFLTRWLSSSTSRRCSFSACLRSVMSRATLDAPITCPDLSRSGDTHNDMSISRPSFATRTVSK
jgi:hypothetical protein